jgi:uncharacterized protein YdaU (DUF1376 family)
VNYFELYPGDYLRDTTRLTLVEHGAYLRLLMAYYAEEEPLPADHDELFTITCAIKPADRDAVRKVADRFFPVGRDGKRHNNRADEEIAKAQGRMEGAEERKSNDAERKRKSRERRAAMFEALQAVGISPDFDVTMNELRDLVAEHVTADIAVTLGVTARDKTGQVTRDSTGSTRHTPHAIPKTSLTDSTQGDEPARDPTDAGRACRLMREAGCLQSNPSHVDLLAALAEGVTPETLADTVREGLAKERPPTKPFTWAIATARSRHAEGARPITGAPHGTRQPRESLVDRNARRAREILERTGTE